VLILGGTALDIVKRKYKNKEVLEIVNACETEYKAQIAEQKNKIYELYKENERLKSELLELKDRETQSAKALIDAEKKAMEISEKAQLQYVLTIEKLKNFSNRWSAYFSELKEKYPMYKPVNKAVDVKARLDAFLKNSPKTATAKDLEQILDGKFNPKQKIDDYIAATEQGFDMNEVLNPGDIKLEDICKELGLID